MLNNKIITLFNQPAKMTTRTSLNQFFLENVFIERTFFPREREIRRVNHGGKTSHQKSSRVQEVLDVLQLESYESFKQSSRREIG